MSCKPLFRSLAVAAVFAVGANQAAQAATEIQFWHAMEAALGERLNDIANDFNASQSDYKIVPVFKGTYDQTLAAGIAAYRSGNAPAILQVYEVGTATMMQAKKAVIPVSEVFKQAGVPLDEKAFVPTIASYYSDSKTGELISMPFNSSTPVLYYNKDAFKKAGLDPNQPPKTWDELRRGCAEAEGLGHVVRLFVGLAELDSARKLQCVAWRCRSRRRTTASTAPTPSSNSTSRCRSRTSSSCRTWRRKARSRYVGRKDEPVSKFYSGDCGIITNSSGSLANDQEVRQVRLRHRHDALRRERERRAAERDHRWREPVGAVRQGSGSLQGRSEIPRLPGLAARLRPNGIRTPAICPSRPPRIN